MRYVIFVMVIFFYVCYVSIEVAFADDAMDEFYDETDLSEAQEVAGEAGIDFREIIDRVYSQEDEDFGIVQVIAETLTASVSSSYEALRHVLLLAVLGAVLSLLSEAFKNQQIGTFGFYICYLCMIGFLMTAFTESADTAAGLLGLLTEFMQALIPAYYLGLTITLGSANGFYGVLLMVIAVIEKLMVNILLPLIKLYLLLMMLNYLQAEDNLSKLAGLVKTVLDWTLKTIFAAAIGLQLIQSLISPYISGINQNLLVKAASAIPGIGSSVSAVSTVIIGSGMLIRNTVGVAGIIVIVCMCAIPILELCGISLIYQAFAAVIQPFADKRMVGCVSAASNAVKLLLRLLCICALMLIITLAILCATRPAYI